MTTEALPFDDELQWHVADPRFLHTTDVSDMLWLRILDVATFLAGADLRDRRRAGHRGGRR